MSEERKPVGFLIFALSASAIVWPLFGAVFGMALPLLGVEESPYTGLFLILFGALGLFLGAVSTFFGTLPAHAWLMAAGPTSKWRQLIAAAVPCLVALLVVSTMLAAEGGMDAQTWVVVSGYTVLSSIPAWLVFWTIRRPDCGAEAAGAAS